MGMDSLTTLQFTDRLGQSLGHPFPATLAFEYPNVDSLCRHVIEDVLGGESVDVDAGADSQQSERALEGLSEADLLSLLSERLKALSE
jgi:hypothetical protein